MKKLLAFCFAISLLLMSFQCFDDEEEPTQFFNDYKVNISGPGNLGLNDTLWIQGQVSARIFDQSVGDSIAFLDYALMDNFSVLQLRSADQSGNSSDALDAFQVLIPLGEKEDGGFCENSEVRISGALSQTGNFYEYRVGLVARRAGDYVLSWNFESEIRNMERNTEILARYPVDGNPKTLGFNRCGRVSFLLDIDTSDGEYFFTIE